METTNSINDQLQVKISTKNVVRFKAGAELSGKVNMVAVEVNEDLQDDQQITEINIQLFKDKRILNQQD